MAGEPVFDAQAVGQGGGDVLDAAGIAPGGELRFLGIGFEQAGEAVEDGGIAEIAEAGARARCGDDILGGEYLVHQPILCFGVFAGCACALDLFARGLDIGVGRVKAGRGAGRAAPRRKRLEFDKRA